MQNIFIAATPLTPRIVLNSNTLEFSVSGKSCPEDGLTYYKFVTDYIEDIKHSSIEKFTFKFDLEYANTSSAKAFVNIIYKMQDLANANVIWMHEQDDDEILELGTDISTIVKVPFTFITKQH